MMAAWNVHDPSAYQGGDRMLGRAGQINVSLRQDSHQRRMHELYYKPSPASLRAAAKLLTQPPEDDAESSSASTRRVRFPQQGRSERVVVAPTTAAAVKMTTTTQASVATGGTGTQSSRATQFSLYARNSMERHTNRVHDRRVEAMVRSINEYAGKTQSRRRFCDNYSTRTDFPAMNPVTRNADDRVFGPYLARRLNSAPIEPEEKKNNKEEEEEEEEENSNRRRSAVIQTAFDAESAIIDKNAVSAREWANVDRKMEKIYRPQVPAELKPAAGGGDDNADDGADNPGIPLALLAEFQNQKAREAQLVAMRDAIREKELRERSDSTSEFSMAAKIQAYTRGRAERETIATRRATVTKIQSLARAQQARAGLKAEKAAATKVQALHRCRTVRLEALKSNDAAKLLQKAQRRNTAIRTLQANKKAATIIQSRFRSRVVQNESRKVNAVLRHALLLQQSIPQGWHFIKDHEAKTASAANFMANLALSTRRDAAGVDADSAAALETEFQAETVDTTLFREPGSGIGVMMADRILLNQHRVEFSAVDPNGVAAGAGVIAGDLLVSINGTRVDALPFAEVCILLEEASSPVGLKLDRLVERNVKSQEVNQRRSTVLSFDNARNFFNENVVNGLHINLASATSASARSVQLGETFDKHTQHTEAKAIKKKLVHERRESSVLMIQSAMRGRKSRERAKSVRHNRAVTVIQSRHRVRTEKRRFHNKQHAALRIQRHCRGRTGRCAVRNRHESARQIQSTFRAKRDHGVVRSGIAARKIQASYRGNAVRRKKGAPFLQATREDSEREKKISHPSAFDFSLYFKSRTDPAIFNRAVLAQSRLRIPQQPQRGEGDKEWGKIPTPPTKRAALTADDEAFFSRRSTALLVGSLAHSLNAMNDFQWRREREPKHHEVTSVNKFQTLYRFRHPVTPPIQTPTPTSSTPLLESNSAATGNVEVVRDPEPASSAGDRSAAAASYKSYWVRAGAPAAENNDEQTLGSGTLGSGSTKSKKRPRGARVRKVRRALAALRSKPLAPAREMVECQLGCDALLKVNEKPKHVRDECPHRLVRCRFDDCGDEIRHCDVQLHESEGGCKSVHAGGKKFRRGQRNDARMRLTMATKQQPCAQGCGAMLFAQAREIRAHNELDCPHRVVDCKHQGCDARIRIVDVSQHDARDCQSAWAKMRRGMGQKERLAALVFSTNQLRRCRMCEQAVPERTMSVHIEKNCPERNIFCRRGCGTLIKAKDVLVHELASCSGGAGGLSRSDWLERRGSAQREAVLEASTSKSRLKQLAQQSLAVKAAGSLAASIGRTYACENCDEMVPLRQRQQHKETECVARMVPCRFGDCRMQIRFCDASKHEVSDCKSKSVEMQKAVLRKKIKAKAALVLEMKMAISATAAIAAVEAPPKNGEAAASPTRKKKHPRRKPVKPLIAKKPSSRVSDAAAVPTSGGGGEHDESTATDGVVADAVEAGMSLTPGENRAGGGVDKTGAAAAADEGVSASPPVRVLQKGEETEERRQNKDEKKGAAEVAAAPPRKKNAAASPREDKPAAARTSLTEMTRQRQEEEGSEEEDDAEFSRGRMASKKRRVALHRVPGNIERAAAVVQEEDNNNAPSESGSPSSESGESDDERLEAERDEEVR